MQTLLYDGSFAGLLSTIFEIYEFGFRDAVVIPMFRASPSLFGDTRTVSTDAEKAARVWRGLERRISAAATKQVYRAFLSEEKEMEAAVIAYIRYAFDNKGRIEYDYTHRAVRYVVDTAKKVYREKHRMEALVRFQQTRDNLYFAIVSPDFNVLPLIQKHFETRYADQRWVIYDTYRKYGLFYDGQSTETVEIAFAEELAGSHDGEMSDQTAAPQNRPPSRQNGRPPDLAAILDEKEALYQHLWQLYFDNVNIKARRNMKLHIRQVPSRYWKFLPEKKLPVTQRL